MQFVRGARCLGVALVLVAACSASAAAQPVEGPHETVDWTFSTTQPGAPTGFAFSGTYHAAGDPNGEPPYMRKMVFTPPPGFRYDSSALPQCTASDLELAVRGPDACPAGSRLGGGTTAGIIYEPFRHDFVFDHFEHPLDVVNGVNEQILLVHSEGYTVVRGKVAPDGTQEFVVPSCFPVPPTGCADDYVLQLKSTSSLAPGRYATTPPVCPAAGYWSSTIRFWWSDGSSDSVATKQPCARPRAAKHRVRHVRKRRSRHR